jgi:hypothetical protein
MENPFTPTVTDFEEQSYQMLKHPKEFQYPNRLDRPLPSMSTGAEFVRRVRPVAVPPPPGFLKAPFAAHGGDAMALVGPEYPASTNATASADGFNVKYVNYVKMRALAGALAGDWSSKCVPLSFFLVHFFY